MPWIRNQRTAVFVGIGLTVAGAAVLYDAYDRRGRKRPFTLRVIGLL